MIKTFCVYALLFSLATPQALLAQTEEITGVPETVVVTGDALGTVSTDNIVNVNATDTTTPTDETSSDVVQDQTGGTVEATNTNSADIANALEVTAGTGSNEVSGNGGDASVQTGDAYADANVLNVVNFNIFDSEGFLLLLNSLYGNLGTIDLRDLAASSANGTCDFCTPLETSVTNDNTASISNSLIVRASTGENGASGNGGDASLSTGNAYASANVVNIANTNITNSNYMMVVLNNMGNWGGDFVLPNADFFRQFFMGGAQGSGNTAVTNNNSATVQNNVSTNADTGGNEANDNGGSSTVDTGNAGASTNVVNQVNQNLFGGSQVVLLFRVFGNWSGKVFNAPQGITWTQTAHGVEVMQDPNMGVTSSTCTLCGSSTSVTNTNTANVNNNVRVFALTGENKVNSNGGNASVQTGNAYAGTNVVNMVNTNIFGRNWIFALINIFGDWTGNISFGQPDLWIGGSASGPGRPGLGTVMTYHFTIANRGDADAHGVKLRGNFHNPYLYWYGSTESEKVWDIGTIPANTTFDVQYDAFVNNNVPGGAVPVDLNARLTLDETDHNLTDNSEVITIVTERQDYQVLDGAVVRYTIDPALEVIKTNDAGERISASTTVNYTIKIKNNGGELYHATLLDQLENDRGDIISNQSWPLDTIKPNEEITITYTLNFNGSTPPGLYTNYAVVKGIARNPSINPLYGVLYESGEASTTVVILPVEGMFGPGPNFGAGIIYPDPVTQSGESAINREPSRSGASSNVFSDISRLWPLAFSADSLTGTKPPMVNNAGSLAGVGFVGSLPHGLDFLILIILILFFVFSRMSWKDFENKFKDKFASFL